MEQFIKVLSAADLSQIYEWVIRILVSLICGVFIGYERKNRQQIVGMRTLLLICISSTLLGILSEFAALSTPGAKGDPGRIAAAVITGIGFVGGGAIMHRGFTVRGITTAAIIWATSAIGLTLGYGLYIPAILVFIIILVGLPAFQKIEGRIFPAGQTRRLSLVYSDSDLDIEQIRAVIQRHKVIISDFGLTTNLKKDNLSIDFTIHAPRSLDILALKEELRETGKLVKFDFSDS